MKIKIGDRVQFKQDLLRFAAQDAVLSEKVKILLQNLSGKIAIVTNIIIVNPLYIKVNLDNGMYNWKILWFEDNILPKEKKQIKPCGIVHFLNSLEHK